MYNEHIVCLDYEEIKEKIEDILNNETDEYDIEEIENEIQYLYDNDKMPSSQYDELMGMIQDI